MNWSIRHILSWGTLVLTWLLIGASDSAVEASAFAPSASIKLCANTGASLETPCTNESLGTGASADITAIITIPSGQAMSSVTGVLLPPGATIPGPEANAQCADSSDSDGDGKLNDGCPYSGLEIESERCTGALDNDPADDAVAGGARVNDGCPAQGAPETACTDATDNDGDTLVNDGCPAVGGESGFDCYDAVDSADAGTRVNDGCPTQVEREPRQVCGDGIDNDLDGVTDLLDTGCRPVGVATSDTDGDGFSDEAEMSIGTDALGRCEVGAAPPMSTDWPLDFVSGGIPESTDKITVTDLTSFLAPVRRLDTYPGHPGFDRRWDLLPGPQFGSNWIAISDQTAMYAGTTGYPPMSGGTKVFGTGFVCSPHPEYGD